MPKFRVELTGRAFVSQTHEVEAENEEEAEKKARSEAPNNHWIYRGVDDSGDDGIDADVEEI
jgi:hypothetical protein